MSSLSHDAGSPSPKLRRPWLKILLAGFWSGLLGGLAMLIVALLLRWLFGFPTATELIFDRSFTLISINFFIESINWAGGYVPLKLNGVYGALGGQLLVAALVGVVYAFFLENVRRHDKTRRWFDPKGLALILPITLFAWIGFEIFLWPQLVTQYRGIPPGIALWLSSLGLLIDFFAAGLGIIFFYGWLTHSSSPITPDQSRRLVPVDSGRRAFLQLIVGAGLAVGFGALLRRLFGLSTLGYDGMTYEGSDLDRITANEDFYSVTKNVVDPDVVRNFWRFEVAGLVEEPKSYSFAQIAELPAVEQETTLMCISNPVGGGLISNAVWKGVPLPRVLALSQPKTGAMALLFHAADGYFETIPIEKALSETTLLAYEMNGEPLPRIHGFPLRMITPGLYGEKNPKWITKVELLAENDPRLVRQHGCGFYKEQGWGPNFTVPTTSRIDSPESDSGEFNDDFKINQPVEFHGMAFGGDRGISKVELSFDSGKSWQEAEITEPGTKISWSFWKYTWTPQTLGDTEIVVRATDGQGQPQIAEERPTVPEGATGLQRITATVAT
ncbi:MAG: molybdopterin-dependent oxidoreductase [Verrucomicrobia bacterium]|nr:molybdopterin-dependent oxidoreductase [Verrucomicrobiota bacterium]